VVGADGRKSKVASQVGAAVLHQDTTAAATIFTYCTGLPSDTIENHYETDHVVGVIPTNDGASVVWVGMSPDRFAATPAHGRAAAHAAQVQRVPGLADALARGERIDRFHAFAGVPGYLRQAWGPGWALVGDAGYFKDPLSAHGITDAFIGAELLAESVVEALGGGRPEDEALGDYQQTRDELARLMMPHVARVAALGDDMEAVEAGFKGMNQALRAEWRLIETRFGTLADAA
jgi:flavin-dependent dehydrogenase